VSGVGGFLRDLGLGRKLRAERYDLAIDFHGGPRASLLTWLSGAPARIAPIPLFCAFAPSAVTSFEQTPSYARARSM